MPLCTAPKKLATVWWWIPLPPTVHPDKRNRKKKTSRVPAFSGLRLVFFFFCLLGQNFPVLFFMPAYTGKAKKNRAVGRVALVCGHVMQFPVLFDVPFYPLGLFSPHLPLFTKRIQVKKPAHSAQPVYNCSALFGSGQGSQSPVDGQQH